ncbi:MAG: hypothetical protein OXN25_24090 [Candidatus Poribacteria bacterium]|nr:hypothetical protein [Candidatus Poribacteria bacterium]
MNVLEMSDSKIYKLGIGILIEQFGLDGTTRFLGICKPRKNDMKMNVQTLSHSEMEKIQEELYKAYRTQPLGLHRNLNQMSDMDFYELGIKAISDQMGPVGMARFIRIRRPGTTDYTAERHKWLDKLDRHTALKGIRQIQEKKCVAARTEDNSESASKIRIRGYKRWIEVKGQHTKYERHAEPDFLIGRRGFAAYSTPVHALRHEYR